MPDELKPRASIDTPEFRNLLGDMLDAYRKELQGGPALPYEKARPKLIAHIDAWRVPPGYKLVPIGSTAEMDLAGRNALRACGNEQATTRDAELCWSAMIEAAPSREDV